MDEKNEFPELDVLLKKIAIQYMCIVTCVFFVFTIFFRMEELSPYWYLTGLYFLLHIIFIFIPLRLEYHSIKLLIPTYLVAISLFLYPIVLFLWQINQVTAFMWFFIFPIGIMVFFETKTVILWTIYILIEVLSIFILSDIFPLRIDTDFSVRQLLLMNILTICSCLTLIAYFIFYLNKTNQMRIELSHLKINKIKPEINIEKHEELYHNILSYFEKEKPYCNSDFTINQLADAMDTNITYISKSININKGMNFNLFLNTYRINLVKKMLGDGYQDRFTIKYIYFSCGFKHQSTFNKVFKLIEGVTPSEYIRKMNSLKSVPPNSEVNDTEID